MFFFSDERCKFPKGEIQLQTEFPFYEPGNVINGVIYINIKEALECSHIELEVKGGEKCSFIRHYTTTEQHGDETRVIHHADKLKHSKKFLEYKNRVFDIDNGALQQGLYQVNFQTELPSKIPSSLNFKEKHSREEPKAKIKYYIKVKLHAANSHDDMKYKQVLAIREKPVDLVVGEAQSETSEIKTWCCISQGTSTMSSVFNKNVFLPNELAEGQIKINNELCNIAAHRVSFFVEQRLTVHADHYNHTHTHRLVERTVEGPGPNVADWQTQLSLNLAEIKYEVAKVKKKKGVQKNVSPEDSFMMAGVQAACHSKKITNEYFLCVQVEYDGCVCCVDLPDSRMPLTIIPLMNPACFGFQPHESGWAPYQLGMFQLSLAHHD